MIILISLSSSFLICIHNLIENLFSRYVQILPMQKIQILPLKKSGSTGQLQSQFADIGLLLRNIVRDNPLESAFNALTWQKYWSSNIQRIFSWLEDIKLAGLWLPKLPGYNRWCRVIITADAGLWFLQTPGQSDLLKTENLKIFLPYIHITCSPQGPV